MSEPNLGGGIFRPRPDTISLRVDLKALSADDLRRLLAAIKAEAIRRKQAAERDTEPRTAAKDPTIRI